MREVIETDSHLVVSALTGDAAAGGVPLALAADHVLAREDVVLNPYYRHMGGLYGSEYWTYLLPRRVGAEIDGAAHVGAVRRRSARARRSTIGLLDAAFGDTAEDVPRRRARLRRAARARRRPTRLDESAAHAPATSSAGRSPPTAARSSRARTRASSGPTAATTRPASASCSSSARRVPFELPGKQCGWASR